MPLYGRASVPAPPPYAASPFGAEPSVSMPSNQLETACAALLSTGENLSPGFRLETQDSGLTTQD